jgi:uridylate kinase
MNLMESFIVSVGGSMINPSLIDEEYVEKFASIIRSAGANKMGVVVGGGSTARSYVSSLKKFTKNDFLLDHIGILATRMNATVVLNALGLDQVIIPEDILSALDVINSKGVVVMGGTVPGHTTDTVSILLAEACGIKKVYNLTSVDMVYADDPKKHPDSKPFEEITYKEAFNISLKSYTGAGSNQFMDSVSLLIAMRSEIEIDLMHGKNLDNFKNALNGKKFIGTKIR